MAKKTHKTIQRTIPKDFQVTYCEQADCRFYGKEAKTGVCYSALDPIEEAYISRLENEARKDVISFRKNYKKRPKEHLQSLEAHYECAMINWHFILDEVTKLRAENSVLKDKTAKTKKKTISAK